MTGSACGYVPTSARRGALLHLPIVVILGSSQSLGCGISLSRLPIAYQPAMRPGCTCSRSRKEREPSGRCARLIPWPGDTVRSVRRGAHGDRGGCVVAWLGSTTIAATPSQTSGQHCGAIYFGWTPPDHGVEAL